MDHYGRAAFIFLEENNHLMALNLCLKALESDDENPMLWYGLGASFEKLSQHEPQIKINLAISCLKKSLAIDPENPFPKKALARIAKREVNGTDLVNKTGLMRLDFLDNYKINLYPDRIVYFVKGLSNLNLQISAIIHLGETKDDSFFELIRYCILEETHRNIVFAALKRVHYFEDSHDLKPIFEEIITWRDNNYEPYFSLALNKINKPWAKDFLKKYGSDIMEKISEAVENPIIDDEVRAIILISLSKFKMDEIEKLYNEKNNKVLAYYLTNGMKDSGIEKIIKSGIITMQGQFTDSGWNLMNEYIITVKSAQSESQPAAAQSKWWQFWK